MVMKGFIKSLATGKVSEIVVFKTRHLSHVLGHLNIVTKIDKPLVLNYGANFLLDRLQKVL